MKGFAKCWSYDRIRSYYWRLTQELSDMARLLLTHLKAFLSFFLLHHRRSRKKTKKKFQLVAAVLCSSFDVNKNFSKLQAPRGGGGLKTKVVEMFFVSFSRRRIKQKFEEEKKVNREVVDLTRAQKITLPCSSFCDSEVFVSKKIASLLDVIYFRLKT